MKKKLSTRNLIIAMLCFTIICLGIGFAILSMKLETKNTEEAVFNVSFSKVIEDTPVKGGKTTPTGTKSITNQGTTLNMTYQLTNPYDELSYSVVIKNNGTIPAEIINVIASPDYDTDLLSKQKIAPVTIEHNDVIGKVLEPNEETILKIVVTYNQASKPLTKKINYQLSLVANTPEK